MNLRPKMLLVFAATAMGGIALLYFLSNKLLLASFRELEVAQVKEEVQYALSGLEQEYRALNRTTNDYAYWDRMHEYMLAPQGKPDIGKEFQDASMEGLELNVVVIRDVNGKIVYAKGYDPDNRREISLNQEFLTQLFGREQLELRNVERTPRDGLVAFPDGAYLVCVRPILNSQRAGVPQGTLLFARKFGEAGAERISDLMHDSVKFQSLDSQHLPADFQIAAKALATDPAGIAVLPLNDLRIGGYSQVRDFFGDPLFVLRVDAPRPIYERGRLSMAYLFATVCCGALVASFVILFFLQKFVLSPISALCREVDTIGNRKALAERVHSAGSDELAALAKSINGMLDQLQRNNQEFQFLTENIHQIYWSKDAHTGQYDYVSHAYERITGVPSETTVKQDPDYWFKLFHPEDRPVVDRMLEQQRLGRPTEAYYRIFNRDGSIRWLWERSFPLLNLAGELEQITGLTEDITDFKRNEEALLAAQMDLENRVAERTGELAERSQLVKLLVDSAPGAMYGMDAEGNCTFINPAGLRVLGYERPEEILGKKSHALFHHTRPDGTFYPQEECPVFRSFRDGHDARVNDELFWHKDGSSFPVEYSSRQIRRDGKVIGAVVSFEDITDRKRQEIELRHSQKLEAVGRLAAGIAHEINTPIQFIGDNTRFLQDSFRDTLQLIHKYQNLYETATRGEVPPELLKDLAAACKELDWPYLEREIPHAMEQMHEGLTRVSGIVRGMKEFSHVDRTNEQAPSDLNRALESTLVVARNEFKYVADVQTEFADLPPVICHLGDLNQVFLNLIVNAAHAIGDVVKTTRTKGKITVVTRLLEGDRVEIAVTDTGTGIPEDIRDKIFDPFFTTKGVGKGTGQGLALARAIVVEKHSGTLTYETRVGKGTTFFVRLPLAGARREEALVK